MSQAEVNNYSNYRSLIRRLLLVVGLWPSEDPRIYYRILPYPFLLANLCVIFGTGFFVKQHSSNIAAITKGLSIMTSFLTITLKMMCVMINHDKYIVLHNILDHNFEEMLIDQQISSSVLHNFRNFRRLLWALMFLVTIITLLIAGRPISSIISQYLHSANSIIFPHLYPTLYPRFQFHFVIEFVATVPFYCVTPSIDSLFMIYIFQMGGQFREMSYRIMHIDEMADYRIAIQQCVHQHQTMMKCRDMLQDIFGPILLWVVAVNAISLCSLIFQLTQIEVQSIPTLLISTTYISFKILQTFIYTYAGTCLTSESESYQQAIYYSDWNRNKRFMSSVLIMLSQKPMILTACNFSIISLNIFLKFLNTTISYVLLLQTLS